jgi:plastocyanin
MRTVSIAALAVVLALCGTARAEDTVIKIENFTFNPPEVTVKPGTTVTWKNADDIPHSVVENDAKFRSQPLDTDESFSMTFAEAGEVGYFCGLHPHMKGKIIVKP